jgi:hypothetical protein
MGSSVYHFIAPRSRASSLRSDEEVLLDSLANDSAGRQCGPWKTSSTSCHRHERQQAHAQKPEEEAEGGLRCATGEAPNDGDRAAQHEHARGVELEALAEVAASILTVSHWRRRSLLWSRSRLGTGYSESVLLRGEALAIYLYRKRKEAGWNRIA